jgi:hypothetical protein
VAAVSAPTLIGKERESIPSLPFRGGEFDGSYLLLMIFFGADSFAERLIDLVTLGALTEVVVDLREELRGLLAGEFQIYILGQQGEKLCAEELRLFSGKDGSEELEEFCTLHRVLAPSSLEASASENLRSSRTPAGRLHT